LTLLFIKLSVAHAYTTKVDSLLHFIDETKLDTNQLSILYLVSDEYEVMADYARGIEYSNKLIELADKLLERNNNSAINTSIQRYKGKAYSTIGLIYFDQGNYTSAIKNHLLSIQIKQVIGDKKGIAISKNNIGLVYINQGEYAKALDLYFQSLKIMQQLNYKEGISATYDNIGLVYTNQGNYTEAIKNLLTALQLKKEMNDTYGMVSTYNTIATVYYYQKKFDQSIQNFQEALEISKKLGEKSYVASIYNNIGSVYGDMAELENDTLIQHNYFQKSLETINLGLEIKKEIGSEAGIASSYLNLGDIYIKLKQYRKADSLLQISNALAKKVGHKEYIMLSYKSLYILDSTIGDFKGAFQSFNGYTLYRDSLDNLESRKKTVQAELNFEFDKKEAIANAEHKKKLESQQFIADAKMKKQNVLTVVIVVGLFLVLVFAIFVLRSLKITQKQKTIIEEQKRILIEQKSEVEIQKTIVEEKQKEIIDSINYAKRIQLSILPTSKYIEASIKRLKK